jgi:hypothetical protein
MQNVEGEKVLIRGAAAVVQERKNGHPLCRSYIRLSF